MNKKAQSATEFVLLISFMLLVFFVFFSVLQNRISDVTDRQDYLYLQEANNVVLTEIELAQQVHADYQRTFTLQSLGDKSYTLSFTDPYEITARFGEKEYVNFLPVPVYGNIKLNQNNTIYKLDGTYTLVNGSTRTNYTLRGVFVNVNSEQCAIHHYNNSCNLLAYQDLCNSSFGLCN